MTAIWVKNLDAVYSDERPEGAGWIGPLVPKAQANGPSSPLWPIRNDEENKSGAEGDGRDYIRDAGNGA